MRIAGFVLERDTHAAVPDAAVSALVNVGREPIQYFSEVRTGQTGGFEFLLDDSVWNSILEKDPEAYVFFRISFGPEQKHELETRNFRRWKANSGPMHIYVDLSARQQLRGTVLHHDKRPAGGVFVAVHLSLPTGPRQLLAVATTDDQGRYELDFRGGASGDAATRREVCAYVTNDLRDSLACKSLVAGTEPQTEVQLLLPPAADALASIGDALEPPLSPKLLDELARLELRTVGNLRAAGGVPRKLVADENLGAEAARLNALVSLSVTGAPLKTLARLSRAGFNGVADLAHRPAVDLIEALGELATLPEVERLRSRASYAVIELANRVALKRLDKTAGGATSSEFTDLFRLTCSCDCASATSPQAYLAHLLRFTLRVARYNGVSFDVSFLQNTLLQPLRDLPASCDSTEQKVSQVRIAVEVLRKHFALLGRTVEATGSPLWYREAAYIELLQYLDLTYDEMRQLANAPADKKAAFIFTKGLGPNTPQGTQIFDDVFRDIAAPLNAAGAVTEEWLQSYFGLRSTLIDPLQVVAVPCRAVAVRREVLRLRWTELDASSARPLGAIPIIDPDLINEVDLFDRVVALPNDDITLWRPIDFLVRRRTEMQFAEDFVANQLTARVAVPVAQRFKDLFAELATTQSFIPGSAIPLPPFGFQVDGNALDFPALKRLRDAALARQDVSAELASFGISAEDVSTLVAHGESLERNEPVTSVETATVRRIVLSHIKRVGFWPEWVRQEAANAAHDGQLVLDSAKFRMRTRDGVADDPVWLERPRLAEGSERVLWEDILRFRAQAIASLDEDLSARIIAFEARLLPSLRDGLVSLTGAGGVYTAAKVDALIDKFQLDFAAGSCRRTTRVSQAIETLQSLLFGIRNGLLNNPAWTIAAADFDSIWRWLGSYDTWLSAVLAFIYPEDLLRPSLLVDPSPGFADALQRLRDADPISPSDAADIYRGFAAYINDVASLELLAAGTYELAAPAGGARSAGYLLAGTVGRDGHRFYWSVVIEKPDDSGDQSWWRQIPAMQDIGEVAGGATCGDYFVVLTTSTVASTRSLDLWRMRLPEVSVPDEDLLQMSGSWEGPIALELPNNLNTFFAVTVSPGGRSTGPTVSIEADELTNYSRRIDQNATGWAGRFRMTSSQPLWQRLGQSSPYGIAPVNGATFACDNNGSLRAVPEGRYVLAADVDNDGVDELLAFAGAEGFWAMKLVMVGPRATWLPLGHRPASQVLDVTLTNRNHTLYFAVTGDFDGDGVVEVAALTEANAKPGSIYTSWMDFFVKKWDRASASWISLGSIDNVATGSQLWQETARMTTRACVVGRFTQSQRDEILVAFQDLRTNLEITNIAVFGMVNGVLQQVSAAEAGVDFAIGPGLSGGVICAGRFQEGSRTDQLLMQEVGAAALATGRFWTLQFQAGRWRSISSLDVGAITGMPKLLAADFDGDGTQEVAFADDSASIRFFKFESGGWNSAQFVATDSPVSYWSVGDFAGDGMPFIIAKCVNEPRAGALAHIDQLNIAVAEQRPDLTLGSGVTVRGLVAGRFAGLRQPSAIAVLGDGCTFYAQLKTTHSTVIARPSNQRFKPHLAAPYRLDESGAQFELLPSAVVAADSLRAFEDNRANRPHHQGYLEEAYYFLIVEIVLRLQSAGDYAAALHWMQRVARLAGDELIPQTRFLSLDAEGALADRQDPAFDPLDGHAVARRRAGAYNRFTVTTVVRLLTDYGDSKFAYANAESLAPARELYISALALLRGHPFAIALDGCAEAIAALIAEVAVNAGIAQLVSDLRALSEVDDALQLNELIAQIRATVAKDQTDALKISAVRELLLTAREQSQNSSESFAARIDNEDSMESAAHLIVLPEVQKLILANLDLIDIHGSFGHRRPPRSVPLPQFSYCIPVSSQHLELKRRIELALFRLRNCLDIAGNELEVAPVGGAKSLSPADAAAGGRTLNPLPYRYQTLVDRAKQLLEIARQLESTMLNYIDAAERKRYETMSARRDLALANAGERLKAVQVEQATQELGVAILQRDRSQNQVDTWGQLLRDGLNDWEIAGLAAQWASFGLKQSAAISTTVRYAATPAGWVKDILTFGAEASSTIATAQADAAGTFAQAASTRSDFERRAQTWANNLRDSRRDVQIGNQQMLTATLRVQGAQVEQQISNLQAAFAAQIVTTLTTKSFANQALYEWMAGVLQGTYRFFLQQATQLARMAESQLAFVRQEVPQGLIKRDYVNRMSADSSPNVNSAANVSDSLRGLTGAANLLRDLYQLDQYAFLKNQRKHELTETVSLARLDPLAFAQLSRTGRMVFETPMSILDSKFPGHYLRLVRRVRMTVIALIPPNSGIRATLSNSGVSQVVISNGDEFAAVTVRRGYEEVAFTAPVDSTGQFDLEAQPELRFVFEDSGLDARWTFDLPRAANSFDYESLADVLVTFEYTALSSPTLRKKVIENLPARRGGTRVFSLRQEFPDTWYDLCNAGAAPVVAKIRLRRGDFPPNLDHLRVTQLELLVRFRDAVTPIDIEYLRFAPPAPALELDGGAAQLDSLGVVSTRRANGTGWTAIVAGAATLEPIGEWRLKFAATALPLFASGVIEEVLMAISFDGASPAWP
ncbi:neuraminidase-like domain-containing protein [Ideonella sp. A 288]|uniref:Tc toxin subunit A-related protein n=1 Tax=Ideonella sp. A 288 TaxID=1962181 RepID=UPI001185D0B7|nr:neuraminidase-like domain-containing protein [Ideonella sp. A 288]